MTGSRAPAADAARSSSLYARARQALGWSFASTAVARFGTLAITVAVARILGPADFGTYAVAMVALLAVLSFNELGVSLAIVRWPGDPDEIAPTVATLSLCSSVLVYLGCFAGAPFFAAAMGEPDATSVVRILTLSVVVDGLVAVPAALLQREFRQGRKTVADQATTWLGALTSISCAVAGLGALSLAVGQLAGAVAGAVLFLAFSPRRLRFGFDRVKAAELLRFGLPLAGSSVVVFAIANVDRIVVGAALGPTLLGVYVLAVNLSNWPVTVFSMPLRSVAPPMMSRLQGDAPALRRTFVSTSGLLAALTVPACALLGGTAAPLVGLVYGSAWARAAAVLPWLAALAALKILFELCYDFFVVLARTRVVLTAQLTWLVALVPATLLGVRLWGPAGGAALQVAVALVLVLPMYSIELHRIGVSLAAVAGRVAVPCAGGLTVALLSSGVARFVEPAWAALVIAAVLGAVVTGALLLFSRADLAGLRGMGAVPADGAPASSLTVALP